MANDLAKALYYGLKNNYTPYKIKHTHHAFVGYIVHFIPNSLAKKKYITLYSNLTLVQLNTTTQSILSNLQKHQCIVYNQNLQPTVTPIFAEIKKFIAQTPNSKIFFPKFYNYVTTKNIFSFIETVFTNKNDKILFFQRFISNKHKKTHYYDSIIQNLNLNHLNSFLDKNLTSSEKDDFLFSFFSNKKSYFKNISDNKKVSNFLLSIYDKNNPILEKYTPFLSYLKENIFSNNLDVFEHFENQYVMNIDLSKASSSLGFKQSSILNSVRKIIQTLSEQENIHVEESFNSPKLTLIFYSHSPMKINQTNIQDILTELLLKQKNEPKFKIMKETVKAWYLNYILQKELNPKDIQTKILKI